jgi:magnesium transporter
MDRHEMEAGSASEGIQAEFFDFRDRTHGQVDEGKIHDEVASGKFVWIDIDSTRVDADSVRRRLGPGVCGDLNIEQIFAAQTQRFGRAPGLQRSTSHLHLSFVGGEHCRTDESAEPLEIVVAEGVLMTVRQGANAVLATVRRDYVHDFRSHAQTPSFLLYEMCKEQVEQFVAVQSRLEEEVEHTRRVLATEIDQATFDSVAAVSAKLLNLRRRVLPVRRALEELTSRKTNLISEATLGFFESMISTLERLLSDLATNREILESALNLSLTVMSHRTNQTMNRLAVVSAIFLPLTFICGIYGMNFQIMPELNWAHGYTFFWALSAGITVAVIALLRRIRLL